MWLISANVYHIISFVYTHDLLHVCIRECVHDSCYLIKQEILKDNSGLLRPGLCLCALGLFCQLK